MIIDSHVHIDSKAEIPSLLESMRKNGIDKTCVMYWPFGKTSDQDEKIWSLTEMVKTFGDYPNLFVIGAMKVTDKKSYSKNIREIESLLKHKKLVALKFYLGYEYYYASDPRADPLLKLCVKYGVPAIFHTGDNWITPKTVNAIVRYASPLYIDDVAVKYPELKIIICHLGTPWVSDAALVIAKHKNVYGDVAGILSYETPDSPYYRIDNDAVRKKIVELIAWCETPRKLVFGTDFGIYPQKEYIDFVNSIPHLTKEDEEFIFFKNAQMLFKI